MPRAPITKWTDPCGCKWERTVTEYKLVKGLPKAVYSSWQRTIPCIEGRCDKPHRPDFPWLRARPKCSKYGASIPRLETRQLCGECRQQELAL